MNLLRTVLVLAAGTASSLASDYRDDGNWDQGGYNDNGGGQGAYDDSMGDYFDAGGGPAPGGGGGHLVKIAAGSAVGWLLGGRIQSQRAAKTLKKKHGKERAAFIQLYREQVGTLQEFNQESARIITAMESSYIARQNGVPAEIDTVPFFMADTDGSKKISKYEFDKYVKEYLSNYPGLKPEDIPRWDSFDHDMSGSITFDEYQQQMAKEIRKAQYRAAKG